MAQGTGGDLSAAVAYAKAAADADPSFAGSYWLLAVMYMNRVAGLTYAQSVGPAHENIRKVLSLDPKAAGETLDAAWSAYSNVYPPELPGVLALLGRTEQAHRAFEYTETRFQRGELVSNSESFWMVFEIILGFRKQCGPVRSLRHKAPQQSR